MKSVSEILKQLRMSYPEQLSDEPLMDELEALSGEEAPEDEMMAGEDMDPMADMGEEELEADPMLEFDEEEEPAPAAASTGVPPRKRPKA